jgi:hypothetical protein
VPGTFFDSVPDGGDAYVLNGSSTTGRTSSRLRSCVPSAVPAAPCSWSNDSSRRRTRAQNKLTDLHKLAGPGGHERTLDEYSVLFEAAGYRLVSATASADELYVLEGEPVGP